MSVFWPRSNTKKVALLLAVAVAGLFGIWAGTRAISTRFLQAPITLPSIGAVLLHKDISKIVTRGPGRLWVLRFDKHVEFVPHHFKNKSFAEPQPIEHWVKHLNAPVVFNAGQFDENLEHLGWLKANDNWLMSRGKDAWLALLVSGPKHGSSWSGIIDLQHTANGMVDAYRHVVQSMMLLDANGKLRTRDTDISACRTVVAQDKQGKMLVLVTEGAVTLGDFARWLKKSSLGIVRAMNLDGGVEAQLAISTPEFSLALYGQYGTGTTVFSGGPGNIRYPLPAVIAVEQPGQTQTTKP